MVVLGMALLVSLIGLSAVAVARVNLRTAAASSESGDCELLALSAIEYAAALINSDSAWRTKYANDTESDPVAFGRGSFTWKLVDEADGDLSAGGLQPVRVYGYGRAGEARRCFSVVLAPGGANQFLNPGIESGVSPWQVQSLDSQLESRSDGPHDGGRYLHVGGRLSAAAGPQQVVTGKVVSGKSYYFEAWVRMTAAAESPWLCIVMRKGGQPDTVFRVVGHPAVFKVLGQPVGLEWTRVHGTLNPVWLVAEDSVLARVETSSSAQDFKLDDLTLIESSSSTAMVPARDTWRQEALP